MTTNIAAHDSALVHDRLQALSRRVLERQEDERRKLAAELHDELGQSLTAIKINLQARCRALNQPMDRYDLDNLQIVEDTLEQVRRMAHGLRPSILDDLGLAPAVRTIAEESARRCQFQLQLAFEGLEKRVPAQFETACFRIAQEALTNIARHADANCVDIRVARVGPRLMLSVRDNGRGFDLATRHKSAVVGGSLGLLGMQERAQILGGQLTLETAPGHGCCLCVDFDLKL